MLRDEWNALPRSIRFNLAQERMVHAFARADKVQPERIRVFRRHLRQNLRQNKLSHLVFIGELAIGDDNQVQAALGPVLLDRPAQGFRDISAAARPIQEDRFLERGNAVDVTGIGYAVIVERQVVANPCQRDVVQDREGDIEDMVFPKCFLHRAAAVQQHGKRHVRVCHRAQLPPERQINLRHRQPAPARHNLIPRTAKKLRVRVRQPPVRGHIWITAGLTKKPHDVVLSGSIPACPLCADCTQKDQKQKKRGFRRAPFTA